MKIKNTVSLIILLIFCLSCKAQQKQNTTNYKTLKIENYTKGNLEIKVFPFGLDGTSITIGQVLKDGSIIFNWSEIDLSTIKGSEFYMSSIKRVVGMNFCNEKAIEESNKTSEVIEVELSLYKKGQYIGFLYPETKKEMQDNESLNRHTSLVLGSSLSWYYSDSDANFKAICKVNKGMG